MSRNVSGTTGFEGSKSKSNDLETTKTISLKPTEYSYVAYLTSVIQYRCQGQES